MKNIDTMLETAKLYRATLQGTPSAEWATVFVGLKMLFFRQHAQGLITSTSHGVDFFDNVIDCIEGRLVWDEQGEYGDNFRKMIAGRSKGDNMSELIDQFDQTIRNIYVRDEHTSASDDSPSRVE